MPQDLPPAGRAIPGGLNTLWRRLFRVIVDQQEALPMRQDPPRGCSSVIPARAPGGVSARRSGVATLAKPNVRPGVQPGWPVRRLASCAHPAGVSARIHASGWLPASRCASRAAARMRLRRASRRRPEPGPRRRSRRRPARRRHRPRRYGGRGRWQSSLPWRRGASG